MATPVECFLVWRFCIIKDFFIGGYSAQSSIDPNGYALEDSGWVVATLVDIDGVVILLHVWLVDTSGKVQGDVQEVDNLCVNIYGDAQAILLKNSAYFFLNGI